MNIPALVFWVLLVILITKAAVFSPWWLVLFAFLAII